MSKRFRVDLKFDDEESAIPSHADEPSVKQPRVDESGSYAAGVKMDVKVEKEDDDDEPVVTVIEGTPSDAFTSDVKPLQPSTPLKGESAQVKAEKDSSVDSDEDDDDEEDSEAELEREKERLEQMRAAQKTKQEKRTVKKEEGEKTKDRKMSSSSSSSSSAHKTGTKAGAPTPPTDDSASSAFPKSSVGMYNHDVVFRNAHWRARRPDGSAGTPTTTSNSNKDKWNAVKNDLQRSAYSKSFLKEYFK